MKTAIFSIALAFLSHAALADMPVPLMSGGKVDDGNSKSSSGAKLPAMQEVTIPGKPGIDVKSVVQKYGTVLDQRPLGAGGLTAWTVEKNGRRLVLYTTGDGTAIISGVVWELQTGKNLTDAFLPDQPPINVQPPLGAGGIPRTTEDAQKALEQIKQNALRGTIPTPVAPTIGALVGPYKGAIPESIQTVDSLSGIKEGKGGQADTLYVIFDPRCPFCQRAYTMLRPYIKKGFTIKWIPAIVLGDDANGYALAAPLLQAKSGDQPDLLKRILGDHEKINEKPSKETAQALARNADFFHAVFQNNTGGTPKGVPVGFFLDHKTGQPRMLTGLSEPLIIQEIFGRLQ